MRKCSKCPREVKTLRRGMCNPCYEAHRYRMKAYGRWAPDRVDAAPVRAHVETLRAAGMAKKAIARRAGIAPQLLDNVVIGKAHGKKPATTVTAKTAAALLAVSIDDAEPIGSERVSAVGSQRRVQALVAFGHTMSSIAAELGLPRTSITPILTQQTMVRASRHEEIRALYERLQLTPGASQAARRLGRERRWPLPFQWDEDAIDDPDAPVPASTLRREPYRPRKAS